MDKEKALKVLGFSAGDTPKDKEIKKAFKKKAVKLHPDVNKSPNAEDEFKELNAAQDLLLNPQPQRQRHQHYQQAQQSIEDFFRNVSGPRVNFSVPHIQKNIKISFKDSVLGSKQTIKVDKKSRCESCVCSECHGFGRVENSVVQGNMTFTQQTSCSVCKGEGRKSDDCKECLGKGVVQKVSEFSINLPGGVLNGQAMRLGGFGNVENHNGRLYNGDIILVIDVEHDKDMRIQGSSVISTIDIPLIEALKGTSRKVRTVFGESSLIIKKNTKHKDTMVLERHGVMRQGAHVFSINVLYPKDTSKIIEALEDK